MQVKRPPFVRVVGLEILFVVLYRVARGVWGGGGEVCEKWKRRRN